MIRQHRMHQLRCADDGIDRAGLYAFGAADAFGLADDHHAIGFVFAVLRIQRFRVSAQQHRQGPDTGFATRRALVDIGQTSRDRIRVRTATGIIALPALGLRQQCVDVLGRRPSHLARLT